MQGADGYQLTWMDAKVGDWVVTPRRGKTVEINALWYNALMLLAGWLRASDQPESANVATHAERADNHSIGAFGSIKADIYTTLSMAIAGTIGSFVPTRSWRLPSIMRCLTSGAGLRSSPRCTSGG
jgi:hypothetical protein